MGTQAKKVDFLLNEPEVVEVSPMKPPPAKNSVSPFKSAGF